MSEKGTVHIMICMLGTAPEEVQTCFCVGHLYIYLQKAILTHIAQTMVTLSPIWYHVSVEGCLWSLEWSIDQNDRVENGTDKWLLQKWLSFSRTVQIRGNHSVGRLWLRIELIDCYASNAGTQLYSRSFDEDCNGKPQTSRVARLYKGGSKLSY